MLPRAYLSNKNPFAPTYSFVYQKIIKQQTQITIYHGQLSTHHKLRHAPFRPLPRRPNALPKPERSNRHVGSQHPGPHHHRHPAQEPPPRPLRAERRQPPSPTLPHLIPQYHPHARLRRRLVQRRRGIRSLSDERRLRVLGPSRAGRPYARVRDLRELPHYVL